jgi:hypothetical protein
MWWTDVKIGGEMDSVLVPSAVIHGLQLWWTDVKIDGEMDSVLVPSAVRFSHLSTTFVIYYFLNN